MNFKKFLNIFRGTRPANDPHAYKRVEAQNMRLYGVPSDEKFDLSKPPVALTEPQLRALATGGLLLSSWWLSLKQVMPVRPEVRQDIAVMLTQDWGIDDAEELEDMMQSLLKNGHRGKLQAKLDQNPAYWRAKFDEHEFLRKLSVHSVAGWDFGRIVCLAYWGLLTDLLDQPTAFAYMEAANALAQQELTSWQDLAASYLAGLIMWNPDHTEDLPFFCDYAKMLLEDDQSVWRLVPWAGR